MTFANTSLKANTAVLLDANTVEAKTVVVCAVRLTTHQFPLQVHFIGYLKMAEHPVDPQPLETQTTTTTPKSRTRPLPSPLKFTDDERKTIAQWVVDTLEEDLTARIEWNQMRLQRIAKLRGWSEVKEYPWPDSSNARVSTLMEDSQRTQDTLHNAVMTSRPVCSAQAIHSANLPKQDKIDQLIDHQMFAEQNGELAIGQLIEAFVNDGVFCAYLPWIRENHEIVDVHEFDPIPDDVNVWDAVAEAFRSKLPENGVAGNLPLDEDGWKWRVTYDDAPLGEPAVYEVDAYWDGGREPLIVKIKATHRTFDGTKIIPKFIDEWVAPIRCGNLQPPTVSNPKGADHVFLLDYVSLDEVKRLRQSKFYNLINDEFMTTIESMAKSGMEQTTQNDEHATQKDLLQGAQPPPQTENQPKLLRRVIAFARRPLKEGGLNDDVVFWVIADDSYQMSVLVKAENLTELYPAIPPRRPFATATYLPVEDRLLGISLLELEEGIYDLLKTTLDQMIDNGTLKNLPWGFYRATSGIRPEVIRMSPGEWYPTADPKNDYNIPQFPNAGESFHFNLYTLVDRMRERLTLMGDLQSGRIPGGGSSALRTSQNFQAALAQGDARPERILRRFFNGLVEVYAQMHEMNRRFLPKGKQVKILGPLGKNQDPYVAVDPNDINGRMRFEFKANILNTTKALAQDGLLKIAEFALAPLLIELGITDGDTAYRLARDVAKILGQEPDKYFKPPSQQAAQPRIQAEQAILLLIQGEMPIGIPAEDPKQHLDTVVAYARSKVAQDLPKEMAGLFQAYLQQVQAYIQQQQQRQQTLTNAGQLQQQLRQGGPNGQPGAPPQGPPQTTNGQAPVQANELADERLPGA